MINVFLTVILVGVVVYILLRPGNRTTDIIGALGTASSTLTKTLSGQYAAGYGYKSGRYEDDR
jgi:ABC-type hemin transport system ATPase subunit